MKAGYISRGRRYTFTLIVFTFTIILLWLCNKNPMINSSLPVQDEFIIFSSDVMIDDDPIESIELEDQDTEVHSQLVESGSWDNKPDQFYKMGQAGVTETLLSAKNEFMHLNNKVCNYGKGRWVADNRRPLYSGFGCKQWLSEAWSCRLTQRSDFSYEGYRWQPENCYLPEFEGSDFLKRMQDKTLAFVGDSLGRQQFQSLMCMITGGEERQDIEDVGYKYDFVGSLRPEGWAYRFPETNTTILYYWSSTLCGIEPINTSDPSTKFAMHLDRPPAFITRFISQIDVLVLNTGHHWNRGKLNANKWIMYVNGKPVKNRKLAEMGNAKNLTIYSIIRWVDSQLDIYPGLKVFFRTISPRHFFNGEWNTGGSCDKTTPMEGGSKVKQDESSDLVVGGAVKGMRVKILDITALSQLRDEGHMSRFSINSAIGVHDCLHWCLPGIPDAWNEILCAQV